ncbi:hypothetical protein SRHO_G00026760 [Serrasalmus rhombeus]
MVWLKISRKPVHPSLTLSWDKLPPPCCGSLHPVMKRKLFLLHIPHAGANQHAAKTGVQEGAAPKQEEDNRLLAD